MLNNNVGARFPRPQCVGNNMRVCLVTGGSKGIGYAIAMDLLKNGYAVAVCARGKTSLDKFAKEASKISKHFLILCGDATNSKFAKKAVLAVIKKFKQLDVLVNNVGGAIKYGSFLELTDQDWNNSFQLNLMTMVHFTKFSLPYLEKSKFPRVVNISSISGIEPGVYNPHYNAMKAATINFSKSLANYLTTKKILVNVICPGTIETEAWQENIDQFAKSKKLSKQQAEKLFKEIEQAKIPLGRLGQGEDISYLVLFLASDRCNWITGTCFHVNGGKLRSMC